MVPVFFWELEWTNGLDFPYRSDMQMKIWQKGLIVCELQED